VGRVLGLDYGRRRVGVAVSDRDRRIASPLTTLIRGGAEADARALRRLVTEEEIETIVVGLPVHTSGRESELSREVRVFATWLEAATGRPVRFIDERYSSREADAMLRDAGLNARAREARRDMLAAHVLLQSFLDAGCPESLTDPGPLLDDQEPP
jgi:putative Holliday junction resolvase